MSVHSDFNYFVKEEKRDLLFVGNDLPIKEDLVDMLTSIKNEDENNEQFVIKSEPKVEIFEEIKQECDLFEYSEQDASIQYYTDNLEGQQGSYANNNIHTEGVKIKDLNDDEKGEQLFINSEGKCEYGDTKYSIDVEKNEVERSIYGDHTYVSCNEEKVPSSSNTEIATSSIQVQHCSKENKTFQHTTFSGNSKLCIDRVLKKVEYKCHRCKKIFFSAQDCITHTASAHNKHQCCECKKVFCYPFNLKKHIEKVHTVVEHKCVECNKVFPYAHNLKKHIKKVHRGVAKHKCILCDGVFSCIRSLRRHVENVHIGIEHVCTVCIKVFSTPCGLKLHRDRVHKGHKHECSECGKIFSFSSSLKRHIENVHIGIEHVCTECKKVFYSSRWLKLHRNSVHKGNKHKCSECKKIFSFSSSLKRHIEKVHKVVKYKCNDCNEIFSCAYNLKIHFDYVHKNVIRK